MKSLNAEHGALLWLPRSKVRGLDTKCSRDYGFSLRRLWGPEARIIVPSNSGQRLSGRQRLCTLQRNNDYWCISVQSIGQIISKLMYFKGSWAEYGLLKDDGCDTPPPKLIVSPDSTVNHSLP